MRRLLDRSAERAALEGLLEDVRGGRGRALMLLGQAGVGKSALLEHTIETALDMSVLRALGVESEMELAFAGVHQLCAPLLDRVHELPGPQREALRVALGLLSGVTPDRFLVGLAVLTLLAAAAEEQPLLCVVDDAQWLDAASVQVLGFVARRLQAERVGLLFCARDRGAELQGLSELTVEGLPDEDARALLGSVVGFGLDWRVQTQILAETAGNPLAILELPRGLTPAQLAAGFGLVGAVPERVEEGFRRRIEGLPAETRALLLVAAADPSGDAALVWRASQRLGILASAAEAARADGILEHGVRLRFRHPLVRSAAYSTASLPQRREAHRALAEETDREGDPDRRAWHLAAAAPGPDEEVADELERSAERAQARGGMAATAAFLGRAVDLSADPARRAGRALAAARASLHAGAFATASEQLNLAAAGPLNEAQRAGAALLRGQLAFASSAGRDAPALLVKAARQLEPLDAGLARETYLEAWIAAMVAGQFAGENDWLEVSRAAQSAPMPQGATRPSDVLLDALSVLVTDGRAPAAPLLKRAARSLADGETTGGEAVRWAVPASAAAVMVWDEERWHTIVAREHQYNRQAGALARFVISASSLATNAVWRGDFALAASLIAEAEAIAAATGTQFGPYPAMLLAGFRGARADLAEMVEAVMSDSRAVGQGVAVQAAQWATAISNIGLCSYEMAATSALQAAAHAPELFVSMLALPELIEAAVRTGQAELAADALARLDDATSIADTDWARGIYARCRALRSDGPAAEDLYRESLDRLSRTLLRPDRARAHLLYGEWLRRELRRSDARVQLRIAFDMFDEIGMDAFAERARRELGATGEAARKRIAGTQRDLTPQEAQISQLAREGLSNPEIGALLYLSPRTVEYHLGKVFAKLGVSSRGRLQHVLPSGASPSPPRRTRDVN